MTEPSAPMTNDLTEIMARALNDKDPATFDYLPTLHQVTLKATARALQEALTSAGYAIVKVEPTETMVKAGALALECEGLEYVMPTDPTAAYKAMIQAATKE